VALVPPRFQAGLMIFTTLVLAFLIVKRTQMFWPNDRIPAVEIYTPQTVSKSGGLPEIINVGMYIDNFSKFDTVGNEFIANCIVWFVLNPGAITLDTLGKFSLKRGIILQKSDPIIKILEKKLLVQYKIRISFSAELDFSAFPVDDHYISLQLLNDFITPSEALFQTTEQDFVIDKNIHLYGWELVEKEATAGYLITNLDPGDTPKNTSSISAVFSLFYSFVGLRFPTSVFLPLIMIFFISLFCFSFGDIARLGIAVGTVTALLAYRFVLDGISPKVGYFMLSDYLFFSVLAATFVVFFVVVLDSFGTGPSLLVKKLIIASLHLTLLSMIAFLLF